MSAAVVIRIPSACSAVAFSFFPLPGFRIGLADTSDFIPRGSNAFSSHEPMPTDLQIIDGFEALRQNFNEENPSVSLEEGAADAQAKAAKPSIEDVLEAWFRAVLSLNAEAPEQRRAITALVKMAMRETRQSARRSGREQH